MDRRNFFRSASREAFALVDELRGIPQFRLDDLGALPKERMGQVCPVILPDVKILVEERRVLAKSSEGATTVLLFDRNSEEAVLFNQFNGSSSIDRIAESLAAEASIERSEAFDRVRGLFLRLVHLGLSAPNNPV